MASFAGAAEPDVLQSGTQFPETQVVPDGQALAGHITGQVPQVTFAIQPAAIVEAFE